MICRFFIRFCIFLSFAPVALSTSYTWTNSGGSRSWTNINNWSPAAIPSETDDVSIHNGTSYGPILSSGLRIIKSLSMGLPGATSCSLTIGSNGQLTVTDTAHLSASGSSSGTLSISGKYISEYSQLTSYYSGDTSTINVFSGEARFKTIFLAHGGSSVMNVSGGDVNVSGAMFVGYNPSSNATLNANGGTLNAYIIYLGHAGNGSININGGTANISGIIYAGSSLGSVANLNISSGILNVADFYLGYAGNGNMDINGGSVNVSGKLIVGHFSGAAANLNLNDGTLYAETIELNDQGSTGGHINVGEGTLIVKGDFAAIFRMYVSKGWVSASNERGILNIDYNKTNAGCTTITSVQLDSTDAFNPYPLNGSVMNDANICLTWTQGDGSVLSEVYVSKDFNEIQNAYRLASDLNCDGITDLQDLYLLCLNWLTDPTGIVPSPDFDNDDEINMLDLSMTANQWQQKASSAFKGCTSTNSFCIGQLDSDEYYWRVDSIDSDGQRSKGDIWRFKTIPKKPTIYCLNLRGVDALPQERQYDIRHVAVCIQGLVNREAPRVFLSSYDYDQVWFNRLIETGGLCEDWNIVPLTDTNDYISKFSNYVNGVILYDADPCTGVASTSLAATVAAGAEDAIAVRKDTNAGSMYNYLVNDQNGPRFPVLLDLTNKFTGTGTIWQTNVPSTGSKKCDAYIWAKTKYLDNGLCDPNLILYPVDMWGLKLGLGFQSHLGNLDYAVSKKAFCLDLSPWGDEAPNDDPTQPLGADLNTFKQILDSCNARTGKSKMIRMSGFCHVWYKYSDSVGCSHTQIDTEWELVKILSSYNTYLEPEGQHIGNISFYSSLLPLLNSNDRRLVQNPAPTYNDMVARGYIDGSGNVVPGNYILMSLGDYDSAAWTLYHAANDRYNDTARGQVSCTWAVNPQLVAKIPVAFDYMYRKKSPKDYFVSSASGAGYVNPTQLYGSRSPSGYPSGLNMWLSHCRNYYRMLDYSISGWIFSGLATVTENELSNYSSFSGDGIGLHDTWADLPLQGLYGYNIVYKHMEGVGDTPSADKIVNNSDGVTFAWYRNVLRYPSVIKDIEDSFAASGNNHQFVDAYTFYYLLRYHLGGNNNYKATWISDTVPRILEAGKTYPVTVNVRNDGWDTWSEAGLYRLSETFMPYGLEPVTEDYGTIRHYLPAGVQIQPGQTASFIYTLQAPPSAGKYDLYFDMVLDGYHFFHSVNNLEWKKEIIVVEDANSIDSDNDGTPDIAEDSLGRLYWHPDDR